MYENFLNALERFMKTTMGSALFLIVSLISPIYFMKTVYTVWFSPYDIFIGFKSQWEVWLVLAISNMFALLSLLPGRKSTRIMQVVMGLWVIDMSLIFLATIIR